MEPLDRPMGIQRFPSRGLMTLNNIMRALTVADVHDVIIGFIV